MSARQTPGATMTAGQFFQYDVRNPHQKDDTVWLFSPQLAKSKKFYLSWTGPYTVVRKINEVNYESFSVKKKKEKSDCAL